MDIVICGAGEVGTHAAEVLASQGHDVTVIDRRPERIHFLEETLDVKTINDTCSNAEVLRRAQAESADLVLAATSTDEINLLAASMGKGVGARKVIARVHHGAYFEQRGLDYREHLGIDHLICPEFVTAQEIARTLRNPAALTIENFAQGRIEMQEITVAGHSPVLGLPLSEIRLPAGTRVAAVSHQGQTNLPSASTSLLGGDTVILVGNTEVFAACRKLLQGEESGRRRIVIMGGNSIAVWLCRALRDRNFSIRLFESSEARALELAEKLDWVTVIHADPTDENIFNEERIQDANSFVALVNHDEHNILACVWAKSMGVKQVIAVAQRTNYLHLHRHVGIDRAFSPRMEAVKEIELVMDDSPLRWMASLAADAVDVYQVLISDTSPTIGQTLKELRLTPEWLVCAIQQGRRAFVPGPEDKLEAGDVVLVVGKAGAYKKLKKVFQTR